MALVTCDECGKSISNRAAACPQCGCPPEGAVITLPRNEYQSTSNNLSSSSGGFAGVLGGIVMIGIGGLVCLVAFKVFNFIICAVGGVMALIGFALMNFSS